jgi:hypothetical protein
VKLFHPTKMKCAVVSALISIAFLPQAFAVLRPLVPAKPEPPFNGEPIIIEDDSVVGTPTFDFVASDYFSPAHRLASKTRALTSSVPRADAGRDVY